MANEVKPPEGNEAEVPCPEQHCCGGKNLDGVQHSPQAKSLKSSVADALAMNGSKQVFDRVRDHLVEDELKRRTDLVLKGLAKKEEIERELRKVKPDQQGLDLSGKVVSETYSKAKVEEVKKLKEQLNKVEKALEGALASEKPCFDKLREVVGK